MKAIIIFLAVLAAFVEGPESQEFVIEATYIGKEEGDYIFVDNDEMEHAFSDIDKKASKKYDLEFVSKCWCSKHAAI